MSNNQFDDKIRWIDSLKDDEIDEILFAIISRYSFLFPDSEMVCLFLPRNNMEERQRILQQVTEFLLSHTAENEK